MKHILQILFLAFFLFSCEKNENVKVAESSNIIETEMAFPNLKGEVKTGYLFGTYPVKYQLINGNKVLSGDMILTDQIKEEYIGKESESTGIYNYRWINNIVYYTIRPDLSNTSRISDAISHWESKTNLRFVQRTNQIDYIEFIPASGCYSNSIGRKSGRQEIGLSNQCTTGNVIHEIGHAIGLFHEQVREDRDNHINILWANIESGYTSTFDKYKTLNYDGFDAGFFDKTSIMMYGSYFFSSNGQPTITNKDGSTFSVQRDYLSNGDVENIKNMYPQQPFDISQWIIEPKGGFYRQGAFIEILWNNSQIKTNSVKIEIFNADGTFHSLASTAAPNTGRFYAIVNTGQYFVKITSNDNPLIFDNSEIFTLEID